MHKNIGVPKYTKKLEDFKRDTNSNTIIVGDFNTPLTSLARSSIQKNQQGKSNLK